MIRFLASGDIHLGRSSTATPELAGSFPADKTWQRLVQKAIELKVNAVLLSGDIIDRENRFFEAVGQLQQGFALLRDAGITVFIIAGNHDFDVLPDAVPKEADSGVHFIGATGKWEVVSFSANGTTVQIAGWSFPAQYISHDPVSSFPANEIDPSFPVIGLLHGEVGKPDSPYAPLDFDRLKSQNVNLWILGHIHKAQLLSESAPEIWYTGSPQALSPKEQGKHGVILCEVSDQHKISTTFLPLSPVQYEEVEIDLTDAATSSDVRNRVMQKIGDFAMNSSAVGPETEQLILDLTLVGEHGQQDMVEATLREITNGLYHQHGSVFVSVRKVKNLLTPSISDLVSLSRQTSPVGLIAQTILAIEQNESTPLLQQLELQWDRAFEDLKNGSAYSDLNRNERDQPFYEKVAASKKNYLLTSCNKLLNALISQQS